MATHASMTSPTGGAGATMLAQLASWPARRWLAALVAAVAAGLLTGLPTDVVPNPFYRRMTPVVWWDYPVWALTAMLFGLLAATYVRVARAVDGKAAYVSGPAGGGKVGGGAFVGGILSVFAVGCPICNKLVVALLGVSGALTYFGPAQPVLGVLGIALLAATLVVRLRRLAACSAPLPIRRLATEGSDR